MGNKNTSACSLGRGDAGTSFGLLLKRNTGSAHSRIRGRLLSLFTFAALFAPLFTTGNVVPTVLAASRSCPCSIWDSSVTPGLIDAGDGSSSELGVKFQADTDGYITGLRYYRSDANTGTHVGHLWSNTGTLLATATFTGESSSGWQEVMLGTPVPVTANTTYVASYHTDSGHYSANGAYFAAGPFDNAPLHALQDGASGPNGVYRYGPDVDTDAGFPTNTWNATNYWVDVVFATSVGPDTTPPTVTSVTPVNGGTAVATGATVTARFSEALDPSTVNSGTVVLRTGSNPPLSASVAYNAGALSATLTPDSALAASTTYTATVISGSNGVKDIAGNPLATDYVWSFTTAAPPPPPPTQGPGGPILVITSPANPFTSYYAEILRTEGFNEFATQDISGVTPTLLDSYSVAILGDMTITAAQTTMLSDWVKAGGNLIAMHPDKQLAGLLGLTDVATSLANGYLLVDTSQAPGAGIVNQTIQFHGTADNYTTSGATTVATLYSDATTATSNPAVTWRSVGTNGGHAAAFTYDLARSVVYTRQGNPAWAGQERDGQPPIRSDDLFYGAAASDPQPDWVNLNKVAIPQADEQQRLLGNLIEDMQASASPLPRFWYFPNGDKAVVIMTGDDHGNGGTPGRFDTYLADSAANCSVADWQCVRSSSYIYPGTAITDQQAAAYTAEGFEIGVHITTDCADWTPAQLASDYATQIAQWESLLPSVPAPDSNRTHCIPWSDWATQPKVELDNGIRLDANYYYWPPEWVQDRPGMFTGSGMPMRFADTDGSMIDVYQAATQMTDESGQSYPFTIDTLLNNALGPDAYYGAFTANMHTDTAASSGSDAIIASAKARGVPVVSGRQMLQWLDGRDASSFGSLSWSGGVLGFTVTDGANTNGLQGMLPATSATGPLTGLTRNGHSATYTTQTINGIEYAFFDATAGTYAASYAADTTPPVISSVNATTGVDGTSETITWSTDEASDSQVTYGTAPDTLNLSASGAGNATSHSVSLTGLAANTTYYYRVSSADVAGNRATYPAAPASPAQFTSPSSVFIDTTASDFGAGTLDSNTYISQTGDGEVILAPTVGAEFSGTSLPIGWTSTPWGTGGTATVSNGNLTLDGARANTVATYGPGRSLEFVATFGNGTFQHAGFGVDLNDSPYWAIFSTGTTTGTLYARTNNGGTTIDTPLQGNLIGSPHLYRIDWTGSAVTFWVDGIQVASHAVSGFTTPMEPIASDGAPGGAALSINWMRMTPYAATGTFTSRVFGTGANTTWANMSWLADTPAGTATSMSVRTGSTPTPDGSWTAFTPIGASGAAIGTTAPYIQYRAVLSTTDVNQTPALQQVDLFYTASADTTPPVVVSTSPVDGATGVAASSKVAATFSESLDPTTVSSSTFTLSRNGGGSVAATVTYDAATETATLSPSAPLAPGAVYTARVTTGVSDLAGNYLAADRVWSFTTGVGTFVDTTSADFGAGTLGQGTYVSQTGDGEVTLAPTVGEEFSGGPGLPGGWSSTPWTGGTSTVSGGALSVDGALATTDALYGPGHSLEFVGTFGSETFQNAGFGVDLNNSPNWAIFSTKDTTTSLYARTNNNGATSDTLIPGNWIGSAHLFRIDWTASSVVFSIDGTVVDTEAVSIGAQMRPVVSDYQFGGSALAVDWIRMTPYASTGTFDSRIFDAGEQVNWSGLSWTADVPAGTSVALAYRAGDTPTPDGTWSSFVAVAATPAGINASARYVQYRAVLSTDDPSVTPVLSDVSLAYVTLGGLDHLGLAPVSATVSPGTSQAYTATGYDSQDNSLGDVTGATTFSISAGGTCTGASCTASVPGDYTVTGTDGSASGTATLHVVAGAILITLQPANTVTTAGQTASFSAAATGTPTPTVRWQVSSNGGTSFTNVAGATATTLTMTNLTVAQSGYLYRAVFTNTGGSVTTSAAKLTVNPMPVQVTGVTVTPITPATSSRFGDTVNVRATVTVAKACCGAVSGVLSFQFQNQPASGISAPVSISAPATNQTVTVMMPLTASLLPNGAGTYSLIASFTSTNTNYAAGSASTSVLVGPPTLFAVGANGGIATSSDGGATWRAQHSPTGRDLLAVATANNSFAVAVGQNGTILRSVNGGVTWTVQKSPVSSDLTSVSFVSSTTGFAVGDNGTILATSDGGVTWKVQKSGTSQALTGVDFVSPSLGFAVGDHGTILSTANRGSTWKSQKSGTQQELTAVSFASPLIGYAVGHNGVIVATTNGGSTWKAQASRTGQDLTAVSFVTSTAGYAVGDNGMMLVTSNGGATWTSKSLPTHRNCYSIVDVDAGDATAVGSGGAIYSTTNGGTTWLSRASHLSTNVYAVAAG